MKLILRGGIGNLGGYEIGIEREFGRIEYLDQQTDPALVKRIVDSFNACEGLSDASVRLMAAGGTKAGNLVERTVAWSLFYSYNNRMALKFLEKARAEIAKTGDPI